MEVVMIHTRLKLAVLAFGLLALGGCASVKIPKIDFIKFPEFKKEAENIGGYPDVADTPQRPTTLRSDEEWDQAAKNIIALRDQFVPPKDYEKPLTDPQVEQKIKSLHEKVEAYKADDPADVKP